MSRWVWIWIVVIAMGGCLSASAEEGIPNIGEDLASSGLPNPTLGGTQLWSDQHFFHEWHIQRRAGSDHCRLLDAHNWQHAGGTFEECLAKLEEIKRQRNLKPMEGKAVVLVHGLAAPACWMDVLGAYLRTQGEYKVFSVEYASTREYMADHARSLANVMKSLEGIDQINLVGYSMGNVVIRRYLAGCKSRSGGWQADPRIHRIVMIAPPNHGSITARRLSGNCLFQAVMGAPAVQLGADWEELEDNLATPKGEFGIIAGGTGNSLGFCLELPGDDDGRISVSSTRLAGAADFTMVPALHELIVHDPRVLSRTLRFLQNGYFISPEEKQPIRAEVAGASAKKRLR